MTRFVSLSDMPREKIWSILGNDRISYTISNMLYVGCMNPDIVDFIYQQQMFTGNIICMSLCCVMIQSCENVES